MEHRQAPTFSGLLREEEALEWAWEGELRGQEDLQETGALGAKKEEVTIGLGQLWAQGQGREMETAPWRRFGMKGRDRKRPEQSREIAKMQEA